MIFIFKRYHSSPSALPATLSSLAFACFVNCIIVFGLLTYFFYEDGQWDLKVLVYLAMLGVGAVVSKCLENKYATRVFRDRMQDDIPYIENYLEKHPEDYEDVIAYSPAYKAYVQHKEFVKQSQED